MIRTGEEYRESIRDGREVWMNGERVDDVTAHPAFRPVVDVRARIYDMAHDEATRDLMSYDDPSTGERNAIGLRLPHTGQDWHDKRRAVDAVMDDVGGVVIRVGDETVERHLDALNRTLLDRLQRGGETFVSNAVVGNRYVLRACIVNFHTTHEDVEAMVAIAARAGRQIDAELR